MRKSVQIEASASRSMPTRTGKTVCKMRLSIVARTIVTARVVGGKGDPTVEGKPASQPPTPNDRDGIP